MPTIDLRSVLERLACELTTVLGCPVEAIHDVIGDQGAMRVRYVLRASPPPVGTRVFRQDAPVSARQLRGIADQLPEDPALTVAPILGAGRLAEAYVEYERAVGAVYRRAAEEIADTDLLEMREHLAARKAASKPTVDIDTSNREGVGLHGDDVVIIRHGVRISREQALVLAAWLVAVADRTGGKRFQEIMLAVLSA